MPFLDLLGSESNLSTVAAQVEALLVARIIHDLVENEANQGIIASSSTSYNNP